MQPPAELSTLQLLKGLERDRKREGEREGKREGGRVGEREGGRGLERGRECEGWKKGGKES